MHSETVVGTYHSVAGYGGTVGRVDTAALVSSTAHVDKGRWLVISVSDLNTQGGVGCAFSFINTVILQDKDEHIYSKQEYDTRDISSYQVPHHQINKESTTTIAILVR